MAFAVDGDHIDIGSIDHHPGAVQGLPEGIHPDLHRAAAHIGHHTLQNHHISLIGRGLELEIVDGGGGDDGTGVANGNDACQLVDPVDQLTAKQTAIVVNVAGANEILLFCQRIADLFHRTHRMSHFLRKM